MGAISGGQRINKGFCLSFPSLSPLYYQQQDGQFPQSTLTPVQRKMVCSVGDNRRIVSSKHLSLSGQSSKGESPPELWFDLQRANLSLGNEDMQVLETLPNNFIFLSSTFTVSAPFGYAILACIPVTLTNILGSRGTRVSVARPTSAT